MKKKTSNLIKNVLLFAISIFLPKVFSFLLIPLYTSYLTTLEYGTIDLITVTSSLLLPIFSLDIQDAVIRFALDKKYDKEDVLSISMKINILGFAVLALLVLIIYFLNIFEFPFYIYVYIIFVFFLNSIYNSVTMFCKGIEKVKSIVIGGTMLSFINIILNILLLVKFKLGIHGYLISLLASHLIVILFLFFNCKLYKYIKLNVKKEYVKEMIVYSFPLIFSCVSWWINSASDKYIISFIVGVEISGIYSISSKIPGIITIFYSVFSQAWSISAIKEFDKNDTDGFFGNLYTLLNFLLCISCSIIMILNIPISRILYSGDFFEAWKYVPPLLISVIFHSIGLFIGNIFTAIKDTKILSITTIIGAVVNTILNFILIYYFKAYGAALATMIGYFIIYILRYHAIKRHINMKANNFKLVISYILLLIQMILAYFGNTLLIFQVLLLIIQLLLFRKEIAISFNFLKQMLKSLKMKK